MTTLFDFEEHDHLELTPMMPVDHPKGGGMVGWFTEWNGQGMAYLSPRTREEHYFRKYEGYAISISILTVLSAREVQTVFIAEDDTETMYEFTMDSFRRGLTVTYEENDPQRVVPTDEARRVWDADEVTLHR